MLQYLLLNIVLNLLLNVFFSNIFSKEKHKNNFYLFNYYVKNLIFRTIIQKYFLSLTFKNYFDTVILKNDSVIELKLKY